MQKVGSKPRIALLGDGVLGGSYGSQGIPVLNDLFFRLSQYYDFQYYSFRRVNLNSVPQVIQVSQVTKKNLPGRVKFLLLAWRVIVDHWANPYSCIIAISDYPSGLFGVLLGKILRTPSMVLLIAFEAVKLYEIEYGNLLIPRLKRITKFVCERADLLIMVAEYQRKLASIHLPTSRRIDVLPLRINPSSFKYRRRLINYPVQFIQVAYYSAIKDQDTMFKAFALVAKEIDCRLMVVGEGFDNPKVKAMLKRLRISEKVNCVGFVPQAELPQFFDNAHVLLHSARFETGCAVIQEAMASGVAVCGTDVGLLADIGDRYAAVVPVANPRKMAEEIINLVNDPLRYEQMTMDSYEWITEQDSVWASTNYQVFIDEILKKS